jgi:hypothetical protein
MQFDKVTAKGKLVEGMGPNLEDCTLARAR